MKAALVRAFLVPLLGIVVLSGCEKPFTEGKQDAAICDPAFLRDQSWDHLPSATPAAQKFEKQFPAPQLSGRPRWYVDARHNEYGRCARDACVDGKCLWHVTVYEQVDGKWAVRMEYDLAPRKDR